MSTACMTWVLLRRAHAVRQLLQKKRAPGCHPAVRHYIPRRAVLYVPGSDERKITKAFGLDVDCVVLDCEDGVAASKKQEARETVARVLGKGDGLQGRRDLAVRINAVSTGLAADDLQCILGASHLPSTLLLPKVEETSQLDYVRDQVERALAGRQPHLELIVCIETARGLLNCRQVLEHALAASHSPPLQLAGLLFGSDDFTASIDEDLLRRQCAEGAAMGFTGKQVIHPSQVGPTQEAFAPTPAQLERAHRLVREFHRHQQQGKGAFVFEGSMIDMPSVRQALNLVEANEAIHGKPSPGQ